MSEKGQSLAATAKAFATYSLVPYLGILFCPGAVVVGGLGIVESYRAGERDYRIGCYISLIVGFLVLVVQSLLWWILYKVPVWARGF
jgi:hypothetical protein